MKTAILGLVHTVHVLTGSSESLGIGLRTAFTSTKSMVMGIRLAPTA